MIDLRPGSVGTVTRIQVVVVVVIAVVIVVVIVLARGRHAWRIRWLVSYHRLTRNSLAVAPRQFRQLDGRWQRHGRRERKKEGLVEKMTEDLPREPNETNGCRDINPQDT